MTLFGFVSVMFCDGALRARKVCSGLVKVEIWRMWFEGLGWVGFCIRLLRFSCSLPRRRRRELAAGEEREKRFILLSRVGASLGFVA